MYAIPENYSLSETFNYGKRGVDVYTDGGNFIFQYYMHDSELGKHVVTTSSPAKIGE